MLGQTRMKIEHSKVRWMVKFVQNRILCMTE